MAIIKSFLPLFFIPLVALAQTEETSDKYKSIRLEANKIQMDDIRKEKLLEGDVQILKGSIILRADRIEITQDEYGFEKAIAFGSQNKHATIQKKKENSEEIFYAEAVNISYNSNTEVVEFFQEVFLKDGSNELHGDYAWYETPTQKYKVKSTKNRARMMVYSKGVKDPITELQNNFSTNLKLETEIQTK